MRLLVTTLALISLIAACGGDSKKSSDAPTAAVPAAATPAPGVTAGASSTATAASSAGAPEENGYVAQPELDELDFGVSVALIAIPGDDGYAYLVTKDGLIRRVSMTDQSGTHEVVLDMRPSMKPDQANEEGLLGLALAPDFATSRRAYVNYTAGPPRQDTVSRVIIPASGAGDVAAEEILLQVEDPYGNHNGGGVQFGPDGMLYIGFGDGGSSGDPQGHGQNKDSLLGKILRIDVSGDGAYTIPPDNPFADGGGRGEIWAYGFRNPWRFDFDPEDGRLWVADVGQGTWEEIDLVVAGGNYGWNTMEGPACFKPKDDCNQEGLILPRASYAHDDGGCSVTGGYVYRGEAMPELDGWFVYGDYCSRKVWAVNTADQSPPVLLTTSGAGVTAFGKSAEGELYMLGYDGAPFKLVRK